MPRTLGSICVLTVAIALAGGSAPAQSTTGSIGGTVRDSAGVPIATAVVEVVGMPFRARTDARGFFLIRHVPPGTYRLRVDAAGLAVWQVDTIRVHAGEAVSVDVRLAAVVEGAAAVGSRAPVTSGALIDSAAFHDLPVLTAREVLVLQPGVVETRDPRGVSLRGSDPGAEAVYVDGALVRNGQRGTSDLLLATNAILEGSLTTGALAADAVEAQSGVVSFVTRTAGPRFAASLRYGSDDVVQSLWPSVGFNRVEAAAGGTIGNRINLFTALALTGQQSLETEKYRDSDAPVYVASGTDTIVHQPAGVGDPFSDTADIAIPRFVQYSGDCDAAGNGGVDCQGLRIPWTPNASYAWIGKLQHSYGGGSLVSLTGLVSQSQSRPFPGVNLYNPQGYAGARLRSSALIVNWIQDLGGLTGKPMALGVNLSRQSDAGVAGVLTRPSELGSRDPFGGFLVGPLDFLVDLESTHDVSIAGTRYAGVHYLDDRQVQCLQAGEAACQDQVPFLNRNDLLFSQPYRLNPYAIEGSLRYAFWLQGVSGTSELSEEDRWLASASLEWHTSARNRARLGADYQRFDSRSYSGVTVSNFAVDIYRERPVRQGAYLEDQLDLGDVTIVGGLRWDRFDSRATYPETPGRISSDTLPFDPHNPTANFIPASVHTAVSPRLQVGIALSPRSVVRFSAAQQVQAPPFDALFQNKNTDLQQTNRAAVFGRDLDLAKTVILELGVRHAFSPDLALDVAAYSKDLRSQVVVRFVQLPDPGLGGAIGDFRVFANSDLGKVRGLDVRLDKRFANLFSGSLVYSYQDTDDSSTDHAHTVAGSAALTIPRGWHHGSTLGKILENTGLFATFRFTSGKHYTLVRNFGSGTTTDDAVGVPASPLEPFNASILPWFKSVDVRLTRSFRLGRFDATLFLESRNLFNFTNVLGVFTETGDVTNDAHRSRWVDEQVAQLEAEAAAHLLLTPGGVDLRTSGICASWSARNTPGSFAGGPVDCVMLLRAERRFGNGDGLFSEAEYTTAFEAWYNFANAPYQFYGPGRRVRVGVEVVF